MRVRRLAGAGTCLTVLALATVGGGFDATPSRSATAGTIVFVSNRDAYQPGEIYSLAPGRQPVDITHSPSTESGLAVSPAGNAIAFWSDRSGKTRLYLARTDGSRLRVVRGFATSGNADVSEAPVFSDDGRQLFADVVPSTAPPDGSTTLPGDAPGTFAVDVAHATARHVLPQLGCLGLSPSPDGRFLACFTNFRLITVYDLAGRARFTVASDLAARWSRLGYLASSTNSSTPQPSNSIVDESGRTLAQFQGTICGWTPDGRLLVFERQGVVRAGDPLHFSRARIVPGASSCLSSVGYAGALEAIDAYGPHVVLAAPGGKPGGSAAARNSPSQDSVRSGPDRLAFITGPASPDVAPVGATIAVRIRDRQGHVKVVGRFPVPSSGIDALRWVPDGRSVLLEARWDTGARLYAVSPAGGPARRFFSDVHSLAWPAWSQDGRRLAYVAAGWCPGSGGPCADAIMAARQDGTDRQLIAIAISPEYPSFSPDGTRIVFLRAGSQGCTIVTVPVSGGLPTDLAPSASCGAPAWSPDGSRIADIVLDPATNAISVRQIDSTTGQTLETIPAATWPSRTAGALSLAWSPDGTRIAFAGKDGIYLLPVSPPAAADLAIPMAGAAHPSFSPDGSQIAFDVPVASTGTQTALMVANSNGSGARVLSTLPLRQSGYPAWQPDP
jgi:Tol biopolymer transport system component